MVAAEASEDDEDYDLGNVLNEIAATDNFSTADNGQNENGNDGDDDDEVAQLREYFTELQAEFRQQRGDQEAEL